MKTILKLACISLVVVLAVVSSPAATPFNLVTGVGPVNTEGDWSGYSAITLIPGGALQPKASSTPTFYIGFTAGTTAVISNMVLYKTKPRSYKVVSSTPVTLGGVSNPTIKVSDTSVCPTQPLSLTSPCIVRLDPLKAALSANSDYFLVIYFTTGTDISTTHGLTEASPLTGYFEGADETQLKAGQTIPGQTSTSPYLTIAVMSN